MSRAIDFLPNYTYSDYLTWEGRWELINGIPFAMSPASAPKHQKVVAKLMHLFLESIENIACIKCDVYDFIDVYISENTILQPDVLIVCNEISKQYLDFPPSLVVEVLSPATALKDKNSKFLLYQDFKVRYYVIVDVDKKLTEFYLLDKSGMYQIIDLINNEVFIDLDDGCLLKMDTSRIWK